MSVFYSWPSPKTWPVPNWAAGHFKFPSTLPIPSCLSATPQQPQQLRYCPRHLCKTFRGSLWLCRPHLAQPVRALERDRARGRGLGDSLPLPAARWLPVHLLLLGALPPTAATGCSLQCSQYVSAQFGHWPHQGHTTTCPVPAFQRPRPGGRAAPLLLRDRFQLWGTLLCLTFKIPPTALSSLSPTGCDCFLQLEIAFYPFRHVNSLNS